MSWGVRDPFIIIITIEALMLNGIHTCIKMYVNKRSQTIQDDSHPINFFFFKLTKAGLHLTKQKVLMAYIGPCLWEIVSSLL